MNKHVYPFPKGMYISGYDHMAVMDAILREAILMHVEPIMEAKQKELGTGKEFYEWFVGYAKELQDMVRGKIVERTPPLQMMKLKDWKGKYYEP